jgi:hypothetical protein
VREDTKKLLEKFEKMEKNIENKETLEIYKKAKEIFEHLEKSESSSLTGAIIDYISTIIDVMMLKDQTQLPEGIKS